MRLRSERIVTPTGTIAGEVAVRNGRITEVLPRSTRDAAGARADQLGAPAIDLDAPPIDLGAPAVDLDAPPIDLGAPVVDLGAPVVDLGARWLVPGYIDTHVHGGGGAQCNTGDPDEVLEVADFHARHGTTAMLATTVAAPLDELEAALRAARACASMPGGASVVGSHLEGPFLSPARPGAMNPNHFLTPDPSAVARLLSAGDGIVRMLTLAPELPDAVPLIKSLSDAGTVVSIGHSDATYEQTEAAIEAGARSVTHLFNAMRPLHHRDPGVLGAALDLPQLGCELICDGVHVSAAGLRLAHRAKGSAGIRLITDAMAAAGMPDGHYRLGATTVTVRGGRATIPGTDSIAAGTLTMDAAVCNAVRFLGVSVEEAVALASTNPARTLGLNHRKGAIVVGMDADLVVLDEDLAACGTLVAGEWLSAPPEWP